MVTRGSLASLGLREWGWLGLAADLKVTARNCSAAGRRIHISPWKKERLPRDHDWSLGLCDWALRSLMRVPNITFVLELLYRLALQRPPSPQGCHQTAYSVRDGARTQWSQHSHVIHQCRSPAFKMQPNIEQALTMKLVLFIKKYCSQCCNRQCFLSFPVVLQLVGLQTSA